MTHFHTSIGISTLPHPCPLPEGEGVFYLGWRLLPEGEGVFHLRWRFLPEGEGVFYLGWRFLPEGEGVFCPHEGNWDKQ